MTKSFFSKLPIFLAIIMFITGCSVPELNKSASDNPDNIVEQQVDIDNYTATTKEAQEVINKLKAGVIQKSEFINGGITDEMFKQRVEKLSGVKNSASFGSIMKSSQPATKPTTADTRPKIYWVGKKYGPAETYYVNAEIDDLRILDNNKPLTPTAYKTTYWSSPSLGNNYDVVLLQETGMNTSFVKRQDFGNNYFRYKILSLNPYSNLDQNWVEIVYDYKTITNDYLYTDLPSNVFEDPNGYPIQETWYWNPPWHFEKITMKTTSTGIRYAVDTREGFEQQILVHRWDKNDFLVTYSGGWHSQGWYIKDFDVENGVVSAILYVPTAPYDEVMMWDVTDEYFNQRIGDTYWPLSYRGLMIDNSW